MAICNRYSDLEMISSFVDGELPSEIYREVQTHLERCPSCNKIVEAYSEVDQIFKANINSTLSDLNFNAAKRAVITRIQMQGNTPQIKGVTQGYGGETRDKSGSPFKNIYNFLHTILFSKIGRVALQMVSLSAVIFFYIVYFTQDTFMSDPPPIVASSLLDPPSAIITSVNGNVSSLMILESADKKMTIIWYKEV